jgi:hypothetical protein
MRLLARFGQIAAYRALVLGVQRAVFGAVPAVTVVLKQVVMPGDTRPLDDEALVLIHVPSSPTHLVPRPASFAAGCPAAMKGIPAAYRERRDHGGDQEDSR